MQTRLIFPLILFFCCWLLPFNGQAQLFRSGQSVEALIFAGRLIRHSPKIRFQVREPSYGFMLSWQQQTDGSQAWHQKHHRPTIGFSLLYYDLGEDDILGEAIGGWPYLGLPLWRREKFDAFFRFGFGLGRINQTFHPVDNPINNAIGSPWNYLVNFSFNGSWQLSSNLTWVGGLHLTHFSNGASRLPNLGVNLIAGQVGIRYTPITTSKTTVTSPPELPSSPNKRWGLNTYLAMGFREYISPGGPRYPIYLASVAATYRLNLAHKLLAGMEYEYNTGAYAFGQHIRSFRSESEARWRSSRLMLFAADEIMFGNWGILFQAGAYLNPAILRPSLIYFKLGSRYYLPPVGRPQTRFYAAFYLKAHESVAEYVSLGIGAEL